MAFSMRNGAAGLRGLDRQGEGSSAYPDAGATQSPQEQRTDSRLLSPILLNPAWNCSRIGWCSGGEGADHAESAAIGGLRPIRL
jgi:hypothetical protein